MDLTLRSGEKIDNNLSVAAIDAAIRSIDSVLIPRGNKKTKLALLKNLVVDELQYLGLLGALPDWRQIQRIPEAGLRAEIVKLHGIPAGDRRALCNQLEQLNRTLNLGLPERIAQGTFGTLPWEGLPTMTPEEMFQAETARMARMVTRANGQADPTEPSPTLETPTLTATPGLASPSPAGGFTQPVPGSHSQGAPFVEPASGEAPSLEASLQAGAAFFVESSQLASEGAPYPFISSNPQVRINPEAALAIAGSNLRDCTDFRVGSCTHTLLFVLFSGGALSKDSSAQNLPLGCLPKLQALNRVHAAIAPQLLASPRAHNLSDFMRLIHKLISQSTVPIVWSSDVFILPEAATSATPPLLGTLTMSVSSSLYKLVLFLYLVMGFGLASDRTFESNVEFKALHDDLLTPRQAQGGGGGLLPQELSHLAQSSYGATLAFKNFLEFPNVLNFAAPFDLMAYFELRATEEGIRNGNPSALDSRIAELLRSQTAGLPRLQRLFFDTPPDDLIALINSLKSLLLESASLSTSIEANSLPVLRALDARLADFESVLPPLSHLRDDLHALTASAALARLDQIRRLQHAQRNLSRSSSGSASSSFVGSSSGTSAHILSLAGLQVTSLLSELQQLPATVAGNKSRLALALSSQSPLVIGSLINLPSQSILAAYPMLGTLHAVSQSLFGNHIAVALLQDFGLDQTTH